MFVEWDRKWLGSAWAYVYREGRNVITVRPDMDNLHWYWSCIWPAQSAPPKKNADGSQWVGGGQMERVALFGKEASEAEAKSAALACFARGRNQKSTA